MGEKHDNYDITKIYGYQFMDEEEKTFFENYGEALEQQAELIAEQHEIDIEEMEKEYDEILQDMIGEEQEYIVDGALLGCTNGCDIAKYLHYEGELFFSEPKNIDKMSRLTILEDRTEKINGYLIPANVNDSTGGLQDDITQNEKVNILGFGNCRAIPNAADLKEILEQYELTAKTDEIIKAIKEGKGTCYCFMQLNKEGWENLSTAGDYLSGNFQAAGGIDKVFLKPSYQKYNDKEGINMLSMLFCNRLGGIITAKESGQHHFIFNKWIEPDASDPEKVKEYMWNFFRDVGYSKFVVAGILGNVFVETWATFNPEIENGYGNYGLFQWDKDRQANMEKWAEERGLDITLVSTQCQYAYYEIEKGGMINIILDKTDYNFEELQCNSDTLKASTSVTMAAKIFATSFERCYLGYEKIGSVMHYKDLQHGAERIKAANEIYYEMAGFE